jgi:hypothetical protein
MHEPSDTSIEATALRETKEEIPGLNHEAIKVMGRLPPVSDKTGTVSVHPCVGWTGESIGNAGDLVVQSAEVSRVYSIPLMHFLDPERYVPSPIPRRPRHPAYLGPPCHDDLIQPPTMNASQWDQYLQFNTVQLNGQRFYRIWGLTGYLIDSFLTVLRPHLPPSPKQDFKQPDII